MSREKLLHLQWNITPQLAENAPLQECSALTRIESTCTKGESTLSAAASATA